MRVKMRKDKLAAGPQDIKRLSQGEEYDLETGFARALVKAQAAVEVEKNISCRDAEDAEKKPPEAMTKEPEERAIKQKAQGKKNRGGKMR